MFIITHQNRFKQPIEDLFGGVNVGGGGGGGGGDAVAAEPVKEKDAFDLKLTEVDPKSKIKIIKEVRAITGLGLKEVSWFSIFCCVLAPVDLIFSSCRVNVSIYSVVYFPQAKEMVEGAPIVVKQGLKKDEAEKLMKVLIDAGAKVELL